MEMKMKYKDIFKKIREKYTSCYIHIVKRLTPRQYTLSKCFREAENLRDNKNRHRTQITPFPQTKFFSMSRAVSPIAIPPLKILILH